MAKTNNAAQTRQIKQRRIKLTILPTHNQLLLLIQRMLYFLLLGHIKLTILPTHNQFQRKL